MGGEPTFVSIDDMDGDEWNTLALGPEKRRLAGELFRRLRDRFATGPLLHFGQGKWYPGEPLPRWALGCYWRRDGEPIWHDPASLCADESKPTAPRPRRRIASRWPSRNACSSIPTTCSAPSRTPGTTCGASGACRATSRSTRPRCDDPMERERLARVFEQGLDTSVGYVLPVSAIMGASTTARPRTDMAAAGAAGRGSCARRSCYLIPGDSPIGYRLPLDSLPWTAPADTEFIAEPDPMAPHPDLPPLEAFRRAPVLRRQERGPVSRDQRRRRSAPAKRGGARWRPTSPASRATARPPPASCAPPCASSRATAISSSSCRRRNAPRIISISSPPSRTPPTELGHAGLHRRLYAARQRSRACISFSVTPDPGVIEVNIHPAASWDELVDNTDDRLRGSAARRGSAREKFMLDGRHTGTGGGNHVVLGGPTRRRFARCCAGPIC